MLAGGAKVSCMRNDAAAVEEAVVLPPARVRLPRGPWSQIPGGVTGPSGFQAAGMYAGLRALGTKPDLALVVSEMDAVCAGTFTTNVVAAAPVLYCKRVLAASSKARAVLINAGQANAATGDGGYQDALDCANAVAELLGTQPDRVLLQSTGVIGKRINKDGLVAALPQLVKALSDTTDGGHAAAVAITTTDLVTKSVAIETEVAGTTVRIGGMAKGSGMIHPNMATMLSVVTCDARVAPDVWQHLVKTGVARSFNQISVDGDTSTNDAVLALASGASGGRLLNYIGDPDVRKLQSALDAVLQGLATSIASDGEGATCLLEVGVTGAHTDTAAAAVARSVTRSSLVKAAVYGRDPNWGRIACAAGYSDVDFDPQELQIQLGPFLLMQKGQPVEFDRSAAKDYLSAVGQDHGVVEIAISIGDGKGQSKAWGCDLSYDYVKINAEYTT